MRERRNLNSGSITLVTISVNPTCSLVGFLQQTLRFSLSPPSYRARHAVSILHWVSLYQSIYWSALISENLLYVRITIRSDCELTIMSLCLWSIYFNASVPIAVAGGNMFLGSPSIRLCSCTYHSLKCNISRMPWHKHPLHSNSELIRIWWSKVKGTVNSRNKSFGHSSRIHAQIITKFSISM